MSTIPFKDWPANYKFAFVLSILAVLAALGLAGAAVFLGWGGGQDYVMVGLLFIVGASALATIPRWAPNGDAEKARRARAKRLRAELKRR